MENWSHCKQMMEEKRKMMHQRMDLLLRLETEDIVDEGDDNCSDDDERISETKSCVPLDDNAVATNIARTYDSDTSHFEDANKMDTDKTEATVISNESKSISTNDEFHQLQLMMSCSEDSNEIFDRYAQVDHDLAEESDADVHPLALDTFRCVDAPSSAVIGSKDHYNKVDQTLNTSSCDVSLSQTCDNEEPSTNREAVESIPSVCVSLTEETLQKPATETENPSDTSEEDENDDDETPHKDHTLNVTSSVDS
eukprot:9435258-Ditylum_brightwellii.AAC.1